MKKIRQEAEINDWILRAFAVAWIVGGVAVGATELIVTGNDVLESGVSWQSWTAGGFAAIASFATVMAWGRRQTPPSA